MHKKLLRLVIEMVNKIEENLSSKNYIFTRINGSCTFRIGVASSSTSLGLVILQLTEDHSIGLPRFPLSHLCQLVLRLRKPREPSSTTTEH